METGATLQTRILQTIDDHADDIINLAEELLHMPEVGYKEFKTSEKVCNVFSELELPYQTGLGITGVRAEGPDHGGPHICLIGELDAVICREHPFADPITGAAHACGHHAQLAALLGAAIGLKASGVLEELPGRVSFCALPAEEYIDLAYRRNLREQGAIQQLSGKQEWIARGLFDDADMAMMVHAHPDTPEAALFVDGKSLGFVEKQIRFTGRAAHASTPEKGINALNAAALAILGMHANRERFRDEDRIRVHPIITKGGDVINSVPDDVCMETYVRGVNFDAILSASEDTDRAIHGAAAMVGAQAEITTQTGYFPLHQSKELSDVLCRAASVLLPETAITYGVDMVGSSDIGDLSHLIPCIQPTVGGFSGTLHGKDFLAADPYIAYVLPAKLLALTTLYLLENNAAGAKQVMQKFFPAITKEEYLMFFNRKEEFPDE